MSKSKWILIALGGLALWLFWPRKGIKTFYLEPIVIQAGGEPTDAS